MKIKQEELYELDAVEVYKMVLRKDIKIFPSGFWQRPEAPQNAIKCTKYMIENILHWDDEDIKTNLNYQTFKDNKLITMLDKIYDSSPYIAINSIYPDSFKPWELKTCPQNYWNEETGKQVMKWLIEEKLKWNDDDIKSKLTLQIFKDNKLKGMITTVYNDSPYIAIKSIYPNRFKPWEFKSTPMNFWNQVTGKQATKWLIEEKLHWDDNDIKEKLNKQIFYNNGLSGLLFHIYNNSVYKAINSAYPNRFKKEELRSYLKNGRY